MRVLLLCHYDAIADIYDVTVKREFASVCSEPIYVSIETVIKSLRLIDKSRIFVTHTQRMVSRQIYTVRKWVLTPTYCCMKSMKFIVLFVLADFDPNCKDEVDNCNQYTTGFCTDSAYVSWAKSHCTKFCGYCGGMHLTKITNIV